MHSVVSCADRDAACCSVRIWSTKAYTSLHPPCRVTGQDCPGRAAGTGGVRALRFHQGAKVATAVARFGFPDAPSFHTVDDLGPYVAGFRRFMLGLLRLRETCRPQELLSYRP